MKVILLQDVKKVGRKGEIVNVSDGYGANYLIPNKLAVLATKTSMEIKGKQDDAAAAELERRKQEAIALKEKLKDVKIEILAKAGNEGRMYGAVSTKQIEEELKKQTSYEIDKRKILDTQSLSSFGVHVIKVELFKGGHHGSPTSSTDTLLDVIQPKHCAVCCCAGSDEYTANVDKQFPAQAFIDRIAKWTDKVYVTSLAENDETGHTTGYTSQNGNIIARSKTDAFNIECSNNNTILKDSEWFNRDIYVKQSSKGEPIIALSTDDGATLRKMRTWPTI